jgi:hypothetical protein
VFQVGTVILQRTTDHAVVGVDEETLASMEIGIVAKYYPEKKFGLLQTNDADVVFFWARDAYHMMLDEEKNQIVFTNKRDYTPRRGDLLVFERAKFPGSAVPEIKYKARRWGSYSTWLFFHLFQMINLKRLTKERGEQEP